MKRYRLSILIPTLRSREDFLRRLLDVLEPQLTHAVKVWTLGDDGEQSIGQKRNALVAMAADVSDYLIHVDDDDLVTPNYVASILKAMKSNPDCVSITAKRYENDRYIGVHLCRLAHDRMRNVVVNPYKRLKDFHRPVNHLCAIRSDIVKQVRFIDANKGEDDQFAADIRPLLKTEVAIEKPIYKYLFRSNRSGEQTNEVVREQQKQEEQTRERQRLREEKRQQRERERQQEAKAREHLRRRAVARRRLQSESLRQWHGLPRTNGVIATEGEQQPGR